MKRRRLFVLAVAAAAAAPAVVRADRTYIGPVSGSWNNINNWSGSVLPGSGDVAFIVNTDGLARNITLDTSPTISGLRISNNGTGVTTLTQTLAVNLTIQNIEAIGTAAAGFGGHNQTNGTNTYGAQLSVGDATAGFGTYSLSGSGVINMNGDLFVGNNGVGTFTQSAGTVNQIGSIGFVEVAAGTASFGTYSMTGGTLSIADFLAVGNWGTGTFIQSGTARITGGPIGVGEQTGGTGNYNLSSGTITVTQEDFGDFGNGVMLQQGGSNTPGVLDVGEFSGGTGFYGLSTGTLSVTNSETIGGAGRGTFSQSGSTHSLSGLMSIGDSSSGNGTYILNSGTLVTNNINANEWVANNGNGTFIQNGGTNSINDSLILAEGATGSGTYLLNTGTLTAKEEHIGWQGTANFIQAGGVNLITSSPSALYFSIGEQGGNGTYQMNGGQLAVQAISGEIVGNSGNGTFIHADGVNSTTDLTVGGNGGAGNYIMGSQFGNPLLSIISNATSTFEKIGNSGNATFTQNGGSNQMFANPITQLVPPSIYVGVNGNGTYLLNGGQIDIQGYEYIGSSSFSTGRFIQTGGINSITDAQIEFGTAPGALYVGYGESLHGNYTISGGTLTVPSIYVGYAGDNYGAAGTFTQNGGFVQANFVSLSATAVSAGTYLMQNGVLDVGLLDPGPNANLVQSGGVILGNVTLDGGTYNVTGGLVLGVITENSGNITGTLTNVQEFDYNAGSFTGSLVNQGSVNFANFFTVGGGVENDATFTVSLGQTLTVNGTGLDNFGTFILDGGALAGATAVNDFGGSMIGHGSIKTSFINNGALTTDGPLTITGAATNSGVINLTSNDVLRASGGLSNSPAGVIQGSGVLIGAVTNNGGLINSNGTAALTIPTLASNINGGELRASTGATLNVNSNFTNAGLISLKGSGATLNGGTITNTGQIRGSGKISNTILNSGIIRVDSGELDLSAAGITQTSSGQIQLDAGTTLSIAQGLATNAGVIQLSGGEFDNSNNPLNNTGSVAGFGTITTSSLTNNNAINLGGGPSNLFGPITNNSGAHIDVTGVSTATFFGNIANLSGATLGVDTGSTAIFLGSVTGSGSVTGGGTRFFSASAILGSINANGTTVVQSTGMLSAVAIQDSHLIVHGQASITSKPIANSPSGTSVVQSLSIDNGARLDLTNNSLIIDYSGTVGTLVNDTRLELKSGQLFSSQADLHHVLGYADNEVLNKATFSGQPVDTTSILIKYTFNGDANLDGKVDVTDLGDLASNWQKSGSWVQGDFNYDGTVNVTDLGILASDWQQGVGNPLGPDSFQQALQAVGLGGVLTPEPATLAITCFPFIFGLFCRGRRTF